MAKVQLQHTATHCNTLQRIATGYGKCVPDKGFNCNHVSFDTLQPTATHYNILQHTATHCNTLQHTATSATCNDGTPQYGLGGTRCEMVRVSIRNPAALRA